MTRVFVKIGDVGTNMMSEKTYKVGTRFPLTRGLSETGRVALDKQRITGSKGIQLSSHFDFKLPTSRRVTQHVSIVQFPILKCFKTGDLEKPYSHFSSSCNLA